MAEGKRYRWTSGMTDVPFVFGGISATALTGPVLLEMLAHLGHRESAARNILVRLQEMGQISSHRHGRLAVYRLGHAMNKYRAVAGADPGPWCGRFCCVIYDVPERDRQVRDRLRHTAAAAGFGTLRPGVLIAPTDRWSSIEHLFRDISPRSWIQTTTLVPTDLDEARTMTERAWDLDSLAGSYRRATHIAHHDRSRDPGWDLFLQWRRLYDVFLDAQLADPDLPVELLPSDWPRAEFLKAQRDVNTGIGIGVVPFLRDRAAKLDPGGLCEFYEPPHETGLPADFADAVLDFVETIPSGKVVTYGLIAEHLGTGGPRQVAAVMARDGGAVPWWRVVRADGTLPESLAARALPQYLAEGTPLRASGAVAIQRAVWIVNQTSG